MNASGTLNNSSAYRGNVGVRPLCALKSEILVSFEEEQIKERAPSIGEMIARGLAEGLRDLFCDEGKDEECAPTEQHTEDQPDDEAKKRADAVDMMKHIAAAFDIPATIDKPNRAAPAADIYKQYKELTAAGFTDAQAWELFTRDLFTPQ